MNEKKSCCFTGHRPRALGFTEKSEKGVLLTVRLQQTIVKLIEEDDIAHFISGMALGVDIYAAEIVLRLKKVYRHITLEAAIPCEGQAAKWRQADRERYESLLASCDRETLLQRRYSADCMQKRNMYMVDHADVVLAVWNKQPSGTGNTVRYALEQNKRVLVLDPTKL